MLDANGNGLGGSNFNPQITREGIPIPGMSGNMGFPSGAPVSAPSMDATNPNLGAIDALNAGQSNSGNWQPQSHSPFMPGYQAPSSAPRFSQGQGGAYSRMQGMGGDGAMAFLGGRRAVGGNWKAGTHAA